MVSETPRCMLRVQDIAVVRDEKTQKNKKGYRDPNSLRHTKLQEAIWNLSKHCSFGLLRGLHRMYTINHVAGYISYFSSYYDKIPWYKQLKKRNVFFAVVHNLRVKSIMTEGSRQQKFKVAKYMPLSSGRRERWMLVCVPKPKE